MHLILKYMGFKEVDSEVGGNAGRLDLLVKPPDKAYVVIGPKFVRDSKRLTQARRIQILARLARLRLPLAWLGEYLALSNLWSNFDKQIRGVLYKNGDKRLTVDGRILLVAETIRSLAQSLAISTRCSRDSPRSAWAMK